MNMMWLEVNILSDELYFDVFFEHLENFLILTLCECMRRTDEMVYSEASCAILIIISFACKLFVCVLIVLIFIHWFEA